jgi:hypothetical protein
MRKGSKHKKESIEKLSKSMKEQYKSGLREVLEDEKHPNWKGTNAGNSAIHGWVRRNFGIPSKCEKCGITRDRARIDWSNKNHKYSRIRSHWRTLCRKCHMNYDFKKFGSWNNIYRIGKNRQNPKNVRIKNNSWSAYFMVNGKRQERGGFKTKKEALKWKNETRKICIEEWRKTNPEIVELIYGYNTPKNGREWRYKI